MDRHHTLDSSMSSLYSGSNISYTPTAAAAAATTPQYYDASATTTINVSSTTVATTAFSTTSPTLSADHMSMTNIAATTTTTINGYNNHDNMISTNINTSQSNSSGTVAGAAASAGQTEYSSGLRATTIGTVVVRCGPIQLVIALLQSLEKLYIKVVELEPKITKLGANLDESLTLQKDHDETLANIQNLPGPMDEFIHKADKLLASKRISSELVNAMADTLNIIWSDILNLLKDRQHILHLCTQFHDKMMQCQLRMDQLEVACTDTMIPIEVAAVQELLNNFKQLRIDMLTSVMAALKDGNELMAQLQELENMESLDTRPEHIKRDAGRAVHQVQQWLEGLHDRRNALEIAWQTRKTQLEQCLALALLGRELLEIDSALQQQRSEINEMFSLGECEQTANKMLQQYKERKHEALTLRDRALKITRSKEKLQASGTFTGDEACSKAYNVLSCSTDHLDLVDQREHWLQQSRDFFSKAEHTLRVLEKLEVQLANVKLPNNSPESYAMYNKVARDVSSFTEEPLKLGYTLLEEVGRTQPQTQGIKRVLDEIENRKIYVERICAHSTEDHHKVQQALEEFLQQYNDLLEWLKLSGQNYLQQHISMGTNLDESKQFLLQHHELMQDLEIKGELINLLLESIKVHLESFTAQQRYDVDSKAEILHNHWIDLKNLVLKRVDYVSVLIGFFEKANEFVSQLDNLKKQLLQIPNEQKLHFLQETWHNMGSNFNDLKSIGSRFLNLKILDPYLETKSSAIAVEDILNNFSTQHIEVTTSLENWSTHIAEKREIEIILEKIIMENEETTTKSTKVDTQLYPIFTSTSLDAKYLHSQTDDKLKSVLDDIDQAQHDIQARVQTTQSLHIKDPESMHKIEQVINSLQTLKTKLDGIRYDYKSLAENVLQFLNNILQLRHSIDEYFTKQQQQLYSDTFERCIAEHERFRDLCTDKFRSLITQSELLIDRVRVLEPAGSKEIDTDRILKLLEDLRLHFDKCNAERITSLERLERVEQFKTDLDEIHHSLNSVGLQLNDIDNHSVDSLASAKTTSLAFEYFERTLELLEKRIDKFFETSKEQLLITNPENESFILEHLSKLKEKWRQFQDQVTQKRKALNQAIEFFEVVEKIDAEYREISYFYNSISNKISYLRDSIEAENLINDIEKYVAKREVPLRQKLDSAAKCPHDMNKVSQLYNEVALIFQNFTKLKSDISLVQERFKTEQLAREEYERQVRDQAERERAIREAELREKAEREEQLRLQALREQTAREQAERERITKELAAREKAIREEEQRLLAVRQQAVLDQAKREQMAKEAEMVRLKALREEELRLQAAREEAKRIQLAREQTARETELVRLQALREEEIRIQKLREQTIKEEEQRLVKLREQAKREEEARLKALLEEETRLQSLREKTQQMSKIRDQIERKEVFQQRTTSKIEQIHQEIFTPLKYEPPTIVQHLHPGIIRESEKYSFECKVKGIPEPTVEWFKDGVSIQNNPDYKTSYNNGVCRLDIEETFTADSGRYTCRASNLVGNVDTSADLSVRENITEIQMIPPRIIRYLESGKAKEGKSYEFTCVVTGNPLPTVQWFKNDKCIDDSPDYVISYNNGEAKLRFEEVFLEDDAMYTCRAKNVAGIEHCSASLMVEQATEKPFFKIPLSNIMARMGQKIKLEALIGGVPQPDIFWQHNGVPYYPRHVKYEYGRVTLIIPQIYLNDSGVYKLIAKNFAGEAFSTCNVMVKGRVVNETSDSDMASDIELIKPSVQVPLKDVAIFEGKAVRLDCVIVGQPEPEVIWYHNDKPVKESTDIQLLFQGDRCTLIIQEVYQDDGGNYKVVAINSAGETSSSCEVKVTPLNILEPATRPQTEPLALPKELEPKFEKFLSDVLVDEGETVHMEVITTGNKPMSAKWYLINQELSENDRIYIAANENTGVFKLTIKNVNAEDKGVYTVKVTNNAGDAKCFSQLIVKTVNAPESQRSQQIEIPEKLLAPEFKEKFTDKTVKLEEVVKFECIVKGKPTPKIHWYFNDQPVQGHSFLVSTSGEREVLTITKVGPDTVGKIACVAENEVGRSECIAFLGLVGSGLAAMPAQADMQMIRQDHETDSSLVSIKKQTFTSTSTSQVSTINGEKAAPPQTEIHQSSACYDKSFKQLNNQRPEIMEQQHFQELHKDKNMSSPTIKQKSFTLMQSANGGMEQTFSTVVPSSPTRTRKEIAPRFTTPLTGKIVDQGVDICLEALYDGFPSPEIKIIRNGDELFENDRLKITNKCNRVTIDLKGVNVNDAGRYAITAKNIMGQTTSTADLVVKKTIFPPVFGKRLQAQLMKKNEKIIMEVEVTGLPEPTVVWMKDDKPLKEAALSAHRLLTQGNSHKLILEKAQITDSGKYIVQATNSGGEAKSIAEITVLEASPERLQDGIKAASYGNKPHEFKTENFNKEPQSFETKHTEITTIDDDSHGISESTITTEHRCTTEATMRLEHKTPHYDLPDVSQLAKTQPIQNNQLPQTTTTTTTTTLLPPCTNLDITDNIKHLKTVLTTTTTTDHPTTATMKPIHPPPVPLKPCLPVPITESSSSSAIKQTESGLTNGTEFTKIDQEVNDNNYKKFDMKSVAAPITPVQVNKEDMGYTNENEQKTESIKQFTETQMGSNLFSLPKQCIEITYKESAIKPFESYYGQPITRPAAVLSTPAQQYTRSPSPKPSAEGLAMEKLWTPNNNHVSGYETATSDLEQNELRLSKLSTPSTELNAPFLVKQMNNRSPLETRLKSPIDEIYLQPGTPPEICFAPEAKERRPSLVETMEKKLEKYIKERGPKKVLPHSVPTLTPAPQSGFQTLNTPSKPLGCKPPPPVMPPKVGKTDYYESDYENDLRKCSGSESDDIGSRSPQKHYYPPSTYKSNGYAADTEDITSYNKMEFSKMEKKSFYESSNGYRELAQPLSPCLERQTPIQNYYYYTQHKDGQDKQESYSASEDKYHHEDKNYKCTSTTKNISYQMSSSATTTPQFKPVKAPVSTPIPAQRKTPAEFSDYSSEVDERFRSVSRNYESESDIKGYRVVYPPTPQPKINGYKSPPSSMEFQPIPSRATYEPVKREMHHEIKTNSMTKKQTSHYQTQQPYQQQQVLKPKPVAAKYLASAQQQQQQKEYKPQPDAYQPQYQAQYPSSSTQPRMYYKGIAGTPLHTAKMATQTENIMHMKESNETSQRVVNMQQTKKVIHFDGGDVKEQRPLEPFPYTPTPTPRATPCRQKVPPLATPTKFIPGEFHESYYDSEIEKTKIGSLWSPMGDSGPLGFRHVEPPQPGRSCSLPRTYERVLSPMEFDRGPEMPKKIQLDSSTLRREHRGTSTLPPQTYTHSQNQRHSQWRSNEQQQYGTNLYQNQQTQQQQQQQNFSRDDMNLKVGSPPRYGYIPPQLEQQGKTMSSVFKKKTHSFMENVTQDLQQMKTKNIRTTFADNTASEPQLKAPCFRPTLKRVPSEGDGKPQAYRDESRVSQYGTKCIDPNTGLVYFKYDFGYEFGILFPGEGHKFVANQWNKSSTTLPKTSSQLLKGYDPTKTIYPLTHGRDLNIPVQHEHTTTKLPHRYNVMGSNPNLSTYQTAAQPQDYYSVTDTFARPTTKHTPSFNNLQQKRSSLPNTRAIDINIDRLHENESLNRLNYADDAGSYTCTAVNGLGSAATTATLQIAGKAYGGGSGHF